ncbi:MAG: hypothetical protein R6V54_09320 [Desulfobacteraceae bacterium]
MEKIVFSDTEYFYKKLQELVVTAGVLEIITDFTSPAQIPRRGRRVLRLGPGRLSRGDARVTGPVINKKFQVRLDHDWYNRVRVVVLQA